MGVADPMKWGLFWLWVWSVIGHVYCGLGQNIACGQAGDMGVDETRWCPEFGFVLFVSECKGKFGGGVQPVHRGATNLLKTSSEGLRR